MIPQNVKYFAVIVHYGPASITDRALQSLAASNQPPDLIVLIDHAERPYRTTLSQVLVIRPVNNIGYGGGINRGLGALVSYAKPSDIVMVMNNDVIFPPATMVKIRQWWLKHQSLAVLSVSSGEKNNCRTGLGRVNLLTGRSELEQVNRPFPPAANSSPRFLPYLHGAFLAAPYEVFLRTAGWPEEYFMYWEDVMFSQRLARLNIPRFTASNIYLQHHSPSSISSAQLYYLVRNGALFLSRETSWPWRLYWSLANFLRLIYHTVDRRQPIVRQALYDAAFNLKGQKS